MGPNAPEAEDLLLTMERAVRPLRRLLGRRAVQRAADPVMFAVGCRRLADGLTEVSWPAGLDDAVGEVIAGLDAAVGGTEDGLAAAWSALRRIDGVLGLPVPLPRSAARVVSVPVVEDPPEASGDAASATADGVEGRQGARRKRRRSRRRDIRKPETPEAAVATAPVAEPDPVVVARGWDSSLEDTGLDDDVVQILADAGVNTVAELLLTAPARETVPGPVHGAGRPLPEGPVAIGGRVRARVTRWSPAPDGPQPHATIVLHGAGRLEVAWEGALDSFTLRRMTRDARVVVTAEVDAEGVARHGRMGVAHHGPGHRPIYHPDPLTDAAWGLAIDRLLPHAESLGDLWPAGVRDALGLAPLARVATSFAHGEATHPDATAVDRLAFDRSACVQLGRAHARYDRAASVRGVAHTLHHRGMVQLELDGRLAPASERVSAALEAIKRDLRGPAPMARVVMGDDLRGVDEVTLRTILLVAEARSQVLVVGPDLPSTLLLFERFGGYIERAGLRTLLLAGEPRPTDAEALRKGDLHVVFAGPGVLEQPPEVRRLGMIVVVEQTEHGGPTLRARGTRRPAPHVLTLVRGELDAATLWQAFPSADVTRMVAPGAQRPSVLPAAEAEREQTYRALAADVAEGLGAVVAFPMRRDGGDLMGRRELEHLADSLSAQVFGGEPVGVLHGAMAGEERTRLLKMLRQRRRSIVVSTLPIEVLAEPGRDLAIVVEHADRMDLSRVLALRAFAGAGGRLRPILGAEPSDSARAAFARLVDGASDAAALAAHGAAVGVSPGLPVDPVPAWVSALSVDRLVQARALAHRILAADPDLSAPTHAAALARAHALWPEAMGEEPPCPLPAPRTARGAGPGRRKRRRRRK